ncbi:MAG: serine hydrolase [Pirellulaceae bacterium]|nr:serine hydrolase [Pirellulaceae bacterium]
MNYNTIQLLHRCFITLTVATCISSTQAHSDESNQFMHGLNPRIAKDLQYVQKNLIRDEVTGSNIVIVARGDKVIYEAIKNSGKQGDRDVTPKTLFPIWSMSKPITIVAMLTLHEKGLFDWDDPISKYIACFETLTVREGKTIRPAKTPLRIIDLMTHRSGYGYYAMDGIPAENIEPEANQTRFRDLQEYCEVAARYPLAFDPGTDFLYGNSQGILGRLVEVLSGQSFSDYLKKTIFDPLGMNDTSFALNSERRKRFQPLFINTGGLKGFTHLLDELNYSPTSRAHFGGDGLVSSPSDYARFCAMLAKAGVDRDSRLVSKASIQEMTEIHSKEISPDDWPGTDMGFSVFVLNNTAKETSKAPRGIYGWAGYHNTHFWIDPQNELYVLFMTRAREFTYEIPKQLRQAVYGSK